MNKEDLKEQIEKQIEELKKLLIPYTRLVVADFLVKIESEKKQLKWYQLCRRMQLYIDKEFCKTVMEKTEKGEYDLNWGMIIESQNNPT